MILQFGQGLVWTACLRAMQCGLGQLPRARSIRAGSPDVSGTSSSVAGRDGGL